MISVIVPFLNEEGSLKELYLRLVKELGQNKFEIIFVNDGSTDASQKIIAEIVNKDSRVRLINFRRNKGKSAALTAGFRKSEGDLVITMDADLQDQPEEIDKLITKLKEGFDLVSGWKKERNDPAIFVYFSRIFNWIIRKTTKVNLHDINCGFKIFRKEVVENLDLYGDLYRFIPVLAAKEGFRVGEIEVIHSLRKYGKSKYDISKFYRGFFDLLTVLFVINFKSKPFRFFGGIGLLFFLTGITTCAYLTIIWFQGQSIGRRPLLILGILLIITGIQLFTSGLLAELIVSRREEVEDL